MLHVIKIRVIHVFQCLYKYYILNYRNVKHVYLKHHNINIQSFIMVYEKADLFINFISRSTTKASDNLKNELMLPSLIVM